MNSFLKKILEATRLTRSGQLGEATAAIRRALSERSRAEDASVIVAERVDESSADARTEPAEPIQIVERVEPVRTVDAIQTVEPIEAIETIARKAAPATALAPDAEVLERSAEPVQAPSREPSFLASSFTNASGTRAFKLFDPGDHEGGKLPLVVMLHGCTQDPDDFAAGTRMNELARESGFFVLYPAQAPRSNANKCWNWFAPSDQRRGAGEPALLAGMVRHVIATHPIDADRVYVAGLSAGAAMAAILAREYPELFAAAGIHSGLPAGAAHDAVTAFAVMKSGPAGAAMARSPLMAFPATAPHAFASSAAPEARPSNALVPTIVFHGDADATVVAANGDAVVAAALGGDAGATAKAHVESGAAAPARRSFRRTVWRAAGAGPEAPSLAEHWLVHGSPHAWSGGASAGSYTDPAGPDASREMLRFFLEHPRKQTEI